MMLVERLRTGAEFHKSESDIGLERIFTEAADELERQAREIERLREVLQEIDTETLVSSCGFCRTIHRISRKALEQSK